MGMLLVGCGGPSGPPRYALKGTVTLNGAPVPKGELNLEPDSSKGNAGPTAIAQIVNGQFDLPADRGTAGGPYKARISGYDGVPTKLGEMEMPDGTSLFSNYTQDVDLPKSNSTLDFNVLGSK